MGKWGWGWQLGEGGGGATFFQSQRLHVVWRLNRILRDRASSGEIPKQCWNHSMTRDIRYLHGKKENSQNVLFLFKMTAENSLSNVNVQHFQKCSCTASWRLQSNIENDHFVWSSFLLGMNIPKIPRLLTESWLKRNPSAILEHLHCLVTSAEGFNKIWLKKNL